MNKNEIPVQLDLEGGFVVSQKQRSKAKVAVKQEFDEYYDNDNGHDAAINEESAADYELGANAAIKEENFADEDFPAHDFNDYGFDDECDAYCMDEFQLQNQDTSLEGSDGEQQEDQSTSKQGTKDEEQPTKPNQNKGTVIKTIQGPPPTLLRQTIQVISASIEKYKPASFSIFSECQWESIVECRCETFNRVSSTLPRGHNKLLMPPVSQKVLALIEDHPSNSHLSKSCKVDTLLWKAIVDYAFPMGGITRPLTLELPYENLISSLVEWGRGLVELFEWKDGRCGAEVKVSEASTSRAFSHDLDGSPKCDDSDYDLDGKSSQCKSDDTRQKSEEFELKEQSESNTNKLVDMLMTIQKFPMDVRVLSDTGVGKSVAKVIKIATKLMKQAKQDAFDEEEIDDALQGYPYFWKENLRLCRRGTSHPYTELMTLPYHGRREEHYKDVTPLQLLQQLLQEWKEMASENGVAMNAESPPSKKHKTDSTKASMSLKKDEMHFPFATYGRSSNIDLDQHTTDLKFLHASTNWKTLYNKLQKREKLVRAAHGEKIRASRELLEKKRRQIGKVTLKKAVGRVRGLGSPSGARGIVGSGQDRREAILNKSRGVRAQMMQAASSSATTPTNKLSTLRQESKVAAKWSKGTKTTVSKIAHNPNTSFSAFGASVASAGCISNRASRSKPKMVGNQARVSLQGGKRITLPASASAKSVGMFSSLQKEGPARKSAGERVSGKKVGKRKR